MARKQQRPTDGPSITNGSAVVSGLTRTVDCYRKAADGHVRLKTEVEVVVNDIQTRQESRRSPKTVWFRGAKVGG